MNVDYEKLNALVTVFLPVKNEAKNLPACLEALKGFSHKVLIDSGSTDETIALAKAAGCEVLDFRWDGHFPKKRNWALQNYAVKTPWVLFLDADERMTETFADELVQTLPTTPHNCFWLYFDNWFMGRMLRHGDVMHKTALLRVGTGGYERIPESEWSNLDMEIHEHLVVKGTSGAIRARLEHHDMRPLKSYYIKHCEYAAWESGRVGRLKGDEKLSRRQRLKYRLIRNPIFPILYFMATYFLKLGFLDGWAGFYFAAGKAAYFYQIQAMLRMNASVAASEKK